LTSANSIGRQTGAEAIGVKSRQSMKCVPSTAIAIAMASKPARISRRKSSNWGSGLAEVPL